MVIHKFMVMLILKTKVRGMIDIAGKFSGDFVDVKGALNVKGDIEVEDLSLTGGLEGDGLLNAENIQISLRYEGSKVREIGGKKITVRKKRDLFLLLVMLETSKLRLLKEMISI